MTPTRSPMLGFVLDKLREGVSVSDEAGVIVYTNAAEDEMFGYDRGELIGMHVSVQNAYSPQENERIVGDVIGQLQERGSWEGEWSNIRKDGSLFSTYARITAFEMDGSKHWICVQEDVTEVKRSTAREQFLDGLAAVLSGSLAEERTLSDITRYCIPLLADYCSIDILTDDGDIQRVETAHVDPEHEVILRTIWARYPYLSTDRVGAPEVLRTGEPQFATEFPDALVEGFARDADHLRLMRQIDAKSYMCVPLAVRGHTFGAISLVYTVSGRSHSRADLDTAMELARRASVAVDNARLFSAERKAHALAESARGRAAFLAEVSRQLAASLDLETTLNNLASLAVPTLADWCFVEMLGDDGNIRPLAIAHSDPQKVALAAAGLERYPIDPDAAFGTPQVLRSGEPTLAPRIPEEALDAIAQDEGHRRLLREIGFHSHVSVPLTVRGKPVGVISLVSAESKRVFGVDDLTLAMDVAHRASAALENAQLYEFQRRERDRLKRIFDEFPTAAAVLEGEDLVFVAASKQYQQLVGNRKLIGLRFAEVFPDLADQGFGDLMRSAITTGQAIFRTDERIRWDKDGNGVETEGIFDFVYQPLPDVARNVGVVVQVADVTERRQAETRIELARAQAEEASHSKSQFLATMSHELRTPLNAIAGHVQLLDMEVHGPVNAVQRDALARVARAQRHLLGLINDVLNFARIEAGKVEYNIEVLDLKDVIADVVAMVEPQFVSKNLTLDVSLPGGVNVQADAEKLRQVLLNLLSNASKFTPSPGRVTIGWEEAPDVILVTVSDTGVGIGHEKLDAVFEPFVQLNVAYSRPAEGTGLGLAISRELARGMGGDLTLESEPGRGSVFTVVLPRAAGE